MDAELQERITSACDGATEHIIIDWIDNYKNWLLSEECHDITGDSRDYTQTRQERDRAIEDSAWSDFMDDYANQWEPTYTSGAGRSWKTQSHIFGQQIWDACWCAIEDMTELEGHDLHDICIEWSETYTTEPPEAEGMYHEWLATKYLRLFYDGEAVDLDSVRALLPELDKSSQMYLDLCMGIDQRLDTVGC